MADIEAERAWLRQHGARQRWEDGERETREWAEQEARGAKTCRYCFHERHEMQIGSASWSGNDGEPWVHDGPGSVIVLYCPVNGCVCGVPSCGSCGRREGRSFRTNERGMHIEACVCGEAWLASAIA